MNGRHSAMNGVNTLHACLSQANRTKLDTKCGNETKPIS